MIYYRNFKFYDENKLINSEHDGFTLLDLIELLCLNPLKVLDFKSSSLLSRADACLAQLVKDGNGYRFTVEMLSHTPVIQETDVSTEVIKFFEAAKRIWLKDIDIHYAKVTKNVLFVRAVFLFSNNTSIAIAADFKDGKILRERGMSVYSLPKFYNFSVYSEGYVGKEFMDGIYDNCEILFKRFGVLEKAMTVIAFKALGGAS